MRCRCFGLCWGAVLVTAFGLGHVAVGQDSPTAPQASPPPAVASDWLAQRAEWHAVMSEWLAERAKPNADPARLAEVQTKLQSLRPTPGTAPAWQPGLCPYGGPRMGMGPGFGRGPMGPCPMGPGYGPGYGRGRGPGMGYGPAAGGYGPPRNFGPGFGPGPGRRW